MQFSSINFLVTFQPLLAAITYSLPTISSPNLLGMSATNFQPPLSSLTCFYLANRSVQQFPRRRLLPRRRRDVLHRCEYRKCMLSSWDVCGEMRPCCCCGMGNAFLICVVISFWCRLGLCLSVSTNRAFNLRPTHLEMLQGN